MVSTEEIAVWILGALKDEWEHDPSPLTCRPDSVVLEALKSKHRIDDADIDRGMRFLADHRMVQAANRADSRAMLPLPSGLKYLAAHRATEKEKGWTLDRRLKFWPMVVALFGSLLAYALWRFSK